MTAHFQIPELKNAPLIRPLLNIGCGFDIPTGRYYTGYYGESILSGGLPHLTGVGGRGNTFKSTIMFFFILRVLERYVVSSAHIYDTEMSLTMARLLELAMFHANIAGIDLEEIGRLTLTDKTVYDGTDWYNMIKKSTEHRKKKQKSDMGTTPFLDKENKFIQYFLPFLVGVDSVSQFNTANIEKIKEENDIGDSGRNTESLRDGGAKSQMIMELPSLTASTGMWMLLSAHMGDQFNLETHNTPQKKLAFLRNNVKFKNVPEKFTFLMNNCWYSISATPLINDTTKAPEFPRGPDDAMKGDTDLMLVQMCNLRGKSGPSGLPFELIVSQSDGVHVGLSEFNYVKKSRFGIEGNLQNYQLALTPDINLSRTTIRRKFSEHAKLRRAMEIINEMAQIINLWHDVPRDLLCTPKELFDDLKAKGFDWDRLLNTRGYWTFDNDKQEVPFLSTMDLLHMRKGLYKPYWY